MRVVIAPDKFKGTASASDIADAIAEAVRAGGHEAIKVPMADGGDGTLEALGGANRVTAVTGPGGEQVDAPWRLSQRVAVIEMALASGLVLAGGPEENDPLNATTRGTGELIEAAIVRGAQRIIVGLGGSATTDGGLGAVEAIGSPARIAGVQLEVATDVNTLFVDAARVFGPQKGATPAQVAFLESRLRGLAERYRDAYGVDVEQVVGGGAAGGLGGGLVALGATIVSGFDLIADELGLFEQIEQADLVVTGEGCLDSESFDGKVVGGVIEMASEVGVPVVVIAGAVADLSSLPLPEHASAISLAERFGIDQAMAAPARCTRTVMDELLAESI
jgi:glycerate kinase